MCSWPRFDLMLFVVGIFSAILFILQLSAPRLHIWALLYDFSNFFSTFLKGLLHKDFLPVFHSLFTLVLTVVYALFDILRSEYSILLILYCGLYWHLLTKILIIYCFISHHGIFQEVAGWCKCKNLFKLYISVSFLLKNLRVGGVLCIPGNALGILH
jgi:hypothetical protein